MGGKPTLMRTWEAVHLRECAGLVAVRGKIVEIGDWDGLVRIAEFDPFYLSLNQRPW
jgi:hypothetical protein